MKKHSVIVETFGSYIRSLRIRNNIGQRELANLIGVAPSYLNDTECDHKLRSKEVQQHI